MEEGNSQFTNLLTGEEIAKILHVSRAYARFPFCPNIAIGRHKPPYVPSDYLETPIYSTLCPIELRGLGYVLYRKPVEL